MNKFISFSFPWNLSVTIQVNPHKILCYFQSEKIWVVVLQNYTRLQKNYHLHWTAGRVNILCKCLICIFSILSVAFVIPFLCYFQKLQLLVIKKFWNNFCCIVLLFVWAQKVRLRFLKSYFKPKILIVLSFLVFFKYICSTKKHFLSKK